MKNVFKLIVSHFVIGALIGSLCYSIGIIVAGQSVTTNPREQVALLVMAGLCGVVSLIFDYDGIPFLWEVVIHFASVIFIVEITAYLNGWYHHQMFTGLMVTIVVLYVAVWIGIHVMHSLTVRDINEQLQKRKAK